MDVPVRQAMEAALQQARAQTATFRLLFPGARG
jgi:hypothetical protein